MRSSRSQRIQLTNEETGAHRKLIPLALRHILSLLIQKFLIFPVNLRRPPLIFVIRRLATLTQLLLTVASRGRALQGHARKILTLHIQGLDVAIAPLLSTRRLLVLWMIGPDIIVGVIVGMCSRLVLGRWSSREIGSRRQRRGIGLCLRRLGGHLGSSILT